MSCRTWLRPYQALRSVERQHAPQCFPLAEIDALHFLVARGYRRACLPPATRRDAARRAAGRCPSPASSCARPGSPCARAASAHDQVHHLHGFLGRHAGGRLVEQQQPRLARERHARFPARAARHAPGRCATALRFGRRGRRARAARRPASISSRMRARGATCRSATSASARRRGRSHARTAAETHW